MSIVKTDQVSLYLRDDGLAAVNSSHFFGTELFRLFEMQSRSSSGSAPLPACQLMQKQHLWKTTTTQKKGVVFPHHLSAKCHICLVQNVFMPTAAFQSRSATVLLPLKLLMNHLAGGRSARPPSSSPSSPPLLLLLLAPPLPSSSHLLPFSTFSGGLWFLEGIDCIKTRFLSISVVTETMVQTGLARHFRRRKVTFLRFSFHFFYSNEFMGLAATRAIIW